MDNELKSFLLTNNGVFDSKDLKEYIVKEGGIPRSRTASFAFAKELRNNFPLAFARVLKVYDSYFIIGESVILPLSRTAAYGIAKNYRLARPSEFVRVLKVDDDYFVITSEEDYNHYWELRKIATRNERKKKNETL